MIYTITDKTITLANEYLYGKNVVRFTFTFSSALGKREDVVSSKLTVDAATFEKYAVGDKIHIGLDIVMAEPDNVVSILGADNATLEPPAHETEEPGLQPPDDLNA